MRIFEGFYITMEVAKKLTTQVIVIIDLFQTQRSDLSGQAKVFIAKDIQTYRFNQESGRFLNFDPKPTNEPSLCLQVTADVPFDADMAETGEATKTQVF
jgi:hypothetical protein